MRNARRLLLSTLLALAPLRAWAGELLVFAAASTREPLEALAHRLEATTGTHVAFSFAGSSTLSRQIAAGAPADLFLSADEASMDRAEGAGRVVKGTRVDLLSNRLVVVVPRDGGAELQAPRDLLSVRRLALADPRGVPAGVYAKAWLVAEGLWQALAPKVVPALDVRAALAAVEVHAADAGIVYATDAAISARVRVAYRVPLERTPPIRYPVARLTHAKGPEADAFLRLLRGPEGRAVFTRYEFLPVGAP